MALIVTCRDFEEARAVLDQISRAINENRITDWAKTGQNNFQNTKKEYIGRACFRPSFKGNSLYFGLINPTVPPYTLTRDLYKDFHTMFFSVLVHLSWIYYFKVEQTPDRLEGVDGLIGE
jgi:hypothetical protein